MTKENKSIFALTDSDKQAREAIARGSNEKQFLMSDLSARYPTEKPSDSWLAICKEEKQWIVQKGKYVGLNKALELTREDYTVYLLAMEAGKEPAKMMVHTCFENAVTLNRIRVQQTADKKAHEKALKALQVDDEEKENNKDVGLELTDTDDENEAAAVIEVTEKFNTVLSEITAILNTVTEKTTKPEMLEAFQAIGLLVNE